MLAAFDRPTGGSQEAHACFGNAEAMGATSSFSHILVQEEEQQRQLAAIVDGYRVGGLDSGALLRMAKDANQQHQLFGGATEEAQRWTETTKIGRASGRERVGKYE